uniref:Uncharacterized protein n=1 Tax=Trichogramma kaykai TaxID=54128 RepID=A0ABD2WK00_9HYME
MLFDSRGEGGGLLFDSTSDDYSRSVCLLASSEESNVHQSGNVKFYSTSIASMPRRDKGTSAAEIFPTFFLARC